MPGFAQEGVDQDKLERGAISSLRIGGLSRSRWTGTLGAELAKDWPSIRPICELKAAIETGIPGSAMPAWSQTNGSPLSDEEIDDLAYYILSWQTGGPPLIYPTPTTVQRPVITPPPGVSGDPNHGAVLYDQNCSVCHGPNGEGRVGATLAKVWPSVRPDLRVKTVVVEGVNGSAMPAWSQANGGPLTEAEIDDIVAYVLSWSAAPGGPSCHRTTNLPQLRGPLDCVGWSANHCCCHRGSCTAVPPGCGKD
jgi:mono/diheme cytochrome c family protein